MSQALSWKFPYLETSAKTCENVDKVFIELLREIRKKKYSRIIKMLQKIKTSVNVYFYR